MKRLLSEIRATLIMIVVSGWLGGCERQNVASRELDADALPMLTLVEELRVGSLEDPNYGFSSIDHVDVDREGRVYVFDRSGFEIRVYSVDGALLHRMGRRGGGPGEFHRETVRFGVVGDTVWAWSGDIDPGRITLFDREGRLLSTAAVEPVWVSTYSGCSLMAPGELGADGLFVGEMAGGYAGPCASDPSGSTLLADSIGIPRVRFTSSGTMLDTAGVLRYAYRPGNPEIITVGASQYQVPEPPGWAPLRIHLSGDRFIRIDRPIATHASAAEFRVSQISHEGDTIFTRAFRYRPVGYSDTMLDSIAGVQSRMTHWAVPSGAGMSLLRADLADSAEARAAIRRRMAFPDFQPPIQAVRVGKDGSIWLRREAAGGEKVRWVVLDPDGSALGQAEVPSSRYRISWIGGSTVWAVETDDLGVPWLVRYRLVNRSPA